MHGAIQKVVVTSVLSFRPLRAICGSAEGEISPKGRNDKGGRGKSSLVVMRHFSVLRGALRVRHEITGTIGRPRFVIGARRDEGAERGSVTEEQRRPGPKMGLPGGPDAFGLRRRRSSLPYSRYARSSLLGSLHNRLGQLSRLCRDGP